MTKRNLLFFFKILVTFLFFLIIIGVFWIKSNFYNTGKNFSDPHYIIVLGAEIEGTKQKTIPGIILRDRLNLLIQYRKKYPKAKIILSGLGKEAKVRGIASEAETMKKYLLNHGINNHDLILEDKSENTYENLRNSQKKIPNKTSKVVIVTSDFHMSRALLIAKRLHLKATGISAHTSEVSTVKNFLREIIAIWYSFIFVW